MPDGSRYRVENGEPVIDVRVATIDRLFDNRDPAPFRERDLDPDLVEYLLGAAEDLSSRAPSFRIVFWLEKQCTPHEVEAAFRAHFDYEIERLDRARRRQRRTGLVALLLGLIAISVLLAVAQLVGNELQGTIGVGLREGLVISCWVLMWRPVDVLLYEWIPWRRDRKVRARLLAAPLEVRIGEVPA
jgi:hypothetical protein